jgi:hypothetical protein
VGCPLQPDLVDTSCSESCAPDAVRACGRAVHLTRELTLLSFQSCPTCPPGGLSIRHQSREQPTSPSIRQCTKSCDHASRLPSCPTGAIGQLRERESALRPAVLVRARGSERLATACASRLRSTRREARVRGVSRPCGRCRPRATRRSLLPTYLAAQRFLG